MIKLRSAASAATFSILAATLGAPASADSAADFYNGRAVTILVVSGSGGLNALYARTVGDRIGKHIPGNPKVIYQYMPGGGGLKGANYCYTAAPKDGSVLCQVLNPLGLMQMIRPKGVKYDAGNFTYIGSTGDQNGSFAVWHTVKANKLMDLQTTNVTFAGTGKGSESYYDPAMVNAMNAAARSAEIDQHLIADERDLDRRPLDHTVLKDLDAVIIDPPRAGARTQAEALAESSVRKIAMVSCNPATFARDARLLEDGGYRLSWIQPIDAFLWSAQIELVGAFERRLPLDL